MPEDPKDEKIRLLEHYAARYGNAEGKCAYGYPQHPHYVCGYCRADNASECRMTNQPSKET